MYETQILEIHAATLPQLLHRTKVSMITPCHICDLCLERAGVSGSRKDKEIPSIQDYFWFILGEIRRLWVALASFGV